MHCNSHVTTLELYFWRLGLLRLQLYALCNPVNLVFQPTLKNMRTPKKPDVQRGLASDWVWGLGFGCSILRAKKTTGIISDLVDFQKTTFQKPLAYSRQGITTSQLLGDLEFTPAHTEVSSNEVG